ncbi:hypothetical protein BC332_34904 [Capsicum chinense]|nr:hypothetical protein BC332_34904 [Capsicum chinense]
MDSTLRAVMSGAIVDPDRLVIGTEDGLFCLDLDHSGNFTRSVSAEQLQPVPLKRAQTTLESLFPQFESQEAEFLSMV